MMNMTPSTTKTKIRTVYHNYNLSTKNFDGNLLYQLYLASTNFNKTDIKFPKPEIRPDVKNQQKRSARNLSRESITKTPQLIRLQQKSSKLMKLITSEYQKRRRSTQFNYCKVQMADKIEQQQVYTKQQSYKTMCKSMEAPKSKIMNNRNNQYFFNRSSQISNKFKKSSIIKKKEKLKIQDFVKPEHIVADPWVEGKLGGFSAQYICIINNGKRIYSYEGNIKRQIASLTKIMTCITAIYLGKKHEIDLKQQQVKVSNNAALLIGTSAQLIAGDVLSLYDLLYGMMLPSGNDAAQTISDFFDKILKQKMKKNVKDQMNDRNSSTKNKQLQAKAQNEQLCISFTKQMNKLASHLNMKNTNFENPHGLSNKNNYSTANDIAQLCHYAMKNQQFRQIVKCQQYQTQIYSSRQKLKRSVKWINTNKLLSLDYCEGIKTGVTPTAGPCMAASFQKSGFSVIIVILNAKTKNKRFQQVKNLYEWAQAQSNSQL